MLLLLLSDATITALVVAIPTTIASLGALIVAVIGAVRSKDNGNKVDRVSEKVDNVSAKAETVLEKAIEIHTTTNGTLHEAKAAAAAANSTRDILEEKYEGLARELAALKLSSSLAAELSKQSATDVRDAQAVMPHVNEINDTKI